MNASVLRNYTNRVAGHSWNFSVVNKQKFYIINLFSRIILKSFSKFRITYRLFTLLSLWWLLKWWIKYEEMDWRKKITDCNIYNSETWTLGIHHVFQIRYTRTYSSTRMARFEKGISILIYYLSYFIFLLV